MLLSLFVTQKEQSCFFHSLLHKKNNHATFTLCYIESTLKLFSVFVTQKSSPCLFHSLLHRNPFIELLSLFITTESNQQASLTLCYIESRALSGFFHSLLHIQHPHAYLTLYFKESPIRLLSLFITQKAPSGLIHSSLQRKHHDA